MKYEATIQAATAARQRLDEIARRPKAQTARRIREAAARARQKAADKAETDKLPLARLRLKLTDLATSIANQRHYDDLKSEIDDILFELDR